MDRDIVDECRTNHGLFAYVIVCNLMEEPVYSVPYMYVRNIDRVREALTVVPVQKHPMFARYSFKDKLLQVTSQNPKVLLSLIDKQDAIIPSLHQELLELQQLDLLRGTPEVLLSERLNSFIKSVRVDNCSEEGILWSPENYLQSSDEEEDEEDEEEEDYAQSTEQGDEEEEDYAQSTEQGDREEQDEDFVRRVICSHINSQSLPMTRIMPIHRSRIDMVRTLANYLGDHYVKGHIAASHFVPSLKSLGGVGWVALATLMAEEFRCIKYEDYVDCNNCFIFDESDMSKYDYTVPNYEAHERLRYYVGDYLLNLNLSRSFITGSAITACLIKTGVDDDIQSWEERIDILYPKVLTNFAPEIHEALKNENPALWYIRAISETEGIMTKGERSYSFTIKQGSDVDIAVDDTVSEEEYIRIVNNHYDVIRHYCPYVKLRESPKPTGGCNYVIYNDNPFYIPIFRTVEIYRSSFRDICSHHVGAVRGCYTSFWSENPQFYLTASGIWTSMDFSTPNYHYFADNKSNPQDVIIKNMQRGINTSDKVLSSIVSAYMKRKGIKISHMPFYCGVGVPSSIFSACYEWGPFQQMLRIKHEQEARRLREQEILRIKYEQEARRIKHEQEARRLREQEARRLREQEARRLREQEARRPREQEGSALFLTDLNSPDETIIFPRENTRRRIPRATIPNLNSDQTGI